jgi:hypothetical protein
VCVAEIKSKFYFSKKKISTEQKELHRNPNRKLIYWL